MPSSNIKYTFYCDVNVSLQPLTAGILDIMQVLLGLRSTPSSRLFGAEEEADYSTSQLLLCRFCILTHG